MKTLSTSLFIASDERMKDVNFFLSENLELRERCEKTPVSLSIEAYRACCDGHLDLQLHTCLYFSVLLCCMFLIKKPLFAAFSILLRVWAGHESPWTLQRDQYTIVERTTAILGVCTFHNGPMLPVSRLFYRAKVNMDLDQVFVIGYAYKVTDECHFCNGQWFILKGH